MKTIDISAFHRNRRSLPRTNSKIRIALVLGVSLFITTITSRNLKSEQSPTVSAVRVSAGYILGPNDQITVSVVELPEFSAGVAYRIDEDGTVSLPLLGRVQAGGLTLAQLENNLRTALQTLVKAPHFVANVIEIRSQVVSVMGSVVSPGTQQIQGSKTLFDALAGAGGVKTDAGELITITRIASEGQLNLPNETLDAVSGSSTAQVKVRDVLELKDPKVNIRVRAHDEISVARARILYVIGNVRKPGGFTMSSGHSLSALEALSLAEGFSANAKTDEARILRRDADQDLREQIPINLKKILAGKVKDVQLSADDILYIPDNTTRRIGLRAVEFAVATVGGILVFKGL